MIWKFFFRRSVRGWSAALLARNLDLVEKKHEIIWSSGTRGPVPYLRVRPSLEIMEAESLWRAK